jgi:hypothetical protein
MRGLHDIHVQSLDSGKAAVDAEFALLATEVNPAIQILKKGGFDVNALHNHFLNESPRLSFLHAGATGDAMTLAKVVRQVLDENAALAAPATTRQLIQPRTRTLPAAVRVHFLAGTASPGRVSRQLRPRDGSDGPRALDYCGRNATRANSELWGASF